MKKPYQKPTVSKISDDEALDFLVDALDHQPMPSNFFRDLSPAEQLQFEQYALDNEPPSLDFERFQLFHPACRRVWIKRGLAPEGYVPCDSCGVNPASVHQFCRECSRLGVKE